MNGLRKRDLGSQLRTFHVYAMHRIEFLSTGRLLMDRREILQSITALSLGTIFPPGVSAGREDARVLHLVDDTIQHVHEEGLLWCRPMIGLVVIGDTHGISPNHPRLASFNRSVFLSDGHFLGADAQESISAAFQDAHMVVLVANSDSEIATGVAQVLRKGILKVVVVAPHATPALLRPHVDALIAMPHWSSLESLCYALVYPLTREGTKNLDFEEARNLLRHDGSGVLGFGSGIAGTAESATLRALESTDLAQLGQVKSVFVGISAPSGAVKVQDVKNSLTRVRRFSPLVASDAIPYSLTPNASNGGSISVAILATGIPIEEI